MNSVASMTVREVQGIPIVDIAGDLTAAAEAGLMAAYQQANADKARTLILNFEGLEYMNSSGIGLLVTLLIRANRQKQRIVTCGLNDHYRQIFQITRLDDAIGIFETEADALAAARERGSSGG